MLGRFGVGSRASCHKASREPKHQLTPSPACPSTPLACPQPPSQAPSSSNHGLTTGFLQFVLPSPRNLPHSPKRRFSKTTTQSPRARTPAQQRPRASHAAQEPGDHVAHAHGQHRAIPVARLLGEGLHHLTPGATGPSPLEASFAGRRPQRGPSAHGWLCVFFVRRYVLYP